MENVKKDLKCPKAKNTQNAGPPKERDTAEAGCLSRNPFLPVHDSAFPEGG